MIDKEIAHDINVIKDYVHGINHLIKNLHEKGVEIRIAYKDSTNGSHTGSPYLDLWRATEHVNYLKETDTDE